MSTANAATSERARGPSRSTNAREPAAEPFPIDSDSSPSNDTNTSVREPLLVLREHARQLDQDADAAAVVVGSRRLGHGVVVRADHHELLARRAQRCRPRSCPARRGARTAAARLPRARPRAAAPPRRPPPPGFAAIPTGAGRAPRAPRRGASAACPSTDAASNSGSSTLIRGRDYSGRSGVLDSPGFAGGRLEHAGKRALSHRARRDRRGRQPRARVRCAARSRCSTRTAGRRRTRPTRSSGSKGRRRALRPAGATVTMKSKAFEPRVTVVGVGSSVEFPNQDSIFHNVFSVSGDNRFDLELYKKPKSASKRVRAPGHRADLLQHPPADERLRAGARQPVLGSGRAPTAASRSRTCRPAAGC